MMKRLVEVKGALQETVVNRLWDGWANKQPYRQTAQDIKDMVMDGSTWRDMNLLVKVMEPIVTLLRLVDSKTPCMGKVYHGCFTVLEQVRTCSVPEDVKGVLEDLAMSRWAMLHSPLHAAGYLLDPEYWDHEITTNEEVMEGFDMVVAKLVQDRDDRSTVAQELGKFRAKVGLFARQTVQDSAASMPAHLWWHTWGGSVPLLQSLAVKVLSQVASACSCERNWSTYDFIHSPLRNKLSPRTAESLVYVFSNLRLLDTVTDVEYEEEYVPWAEEEDSEESEEEILPRMADDDD